jgi:hypothetical protein
LACAKLYKALRTQPAEDAFPTILLAEDEFIEVHIYGKLHRDSLESIRVLRPVCGPDEVLLTEIDRTFGDQITIEKEIMRVIVSGQAGIALLIEGAVGTMITVEGERCVTAPDERVRLFADSVDAEEFADISEQDAVAELHRAWCKDRSLHMILMLLDPQTGLDQRAKAAAHLKAFFCRPGGSGVYCQPDAQRRLAAISRSNNRSQYRIRAGSRHLSQP